jgi:predicted transposase YbfD/YdcC
VTFGQKTDWGIENLVHRVLDLAFRFEECRIRQNHAAQHFALLRRIAEIFSEGKVRQKRQTPQKTDRRMGP